MAAAGLQVGVCQSVDLPTDSVQKLSTINANPASSTSRPCLVLLNNNLCPLLLLHISHYDVLKKMSGCKRRLRDGTFCTYPNPNPTPVREASSLLYEQTHKAVTCKHFQDLSFPLEPDQYISEVFQWFVTHLQHILSLCDSSPLEKILPYVCMSLSLLVCAGTTQKAEQNGLAAHK